MPKNILIVDDDPDVVLFLSTVLKDHGYITVDASNGREGLERAKSDHPDLILLDLMMPQKSGIALLSDLRKDDALKEIPVIMVTGVSGETGIDVAGEVSLWKCGSYGYADLGPKTAFLAFKTLCLHVARGQETGQYEGAQDPSTPNVGSHNE